MRLPLIASIVTLYVAISTHAVPAPYNNIEAPLASIDESCSDPPFCEQFVLELASNFSSFYFQKMAKDASVDTVISPFNLFIPLSLLSYGARGETRKMFLDAIGLPESKTQMAKVGYKNFLRKLAKYDVRLKTKIFVPSGVTLKPNFVDLSTKVFNSEIQFVDVTDGFINSSQINKWVAVQTNNNVTSLFKHQEIGPDPSIVLVNTIYFKGIWKQAFNRSLTLQRGFRIFLSQPYDVPTMQTNGRFRHGRFDEIDANFIELPYKSNGEDDATSMFIILPDRQQGPLIYKDTFVELKIRNMDLNRYFNSTEEELEVYLPKFKIDTEVSLKRVLNEILNPDLSRTENHVNKRPDVEEIRGRVYKFYAHPPSKIENYPNFETGNFSGIFESSRLSNIGESRTKVVIEVDEEGERVAESSENFYKTSEIASSDRKTRSVAGSPKQFKVDRSFYAVILTKGKVLTSLFTMFVPGHCLVPEGVGVF